MGEVSKKHRTLVEERDGGCVAARQLPGRCFGHLDVHHLVNRGMGGSPDDDLYDTPAWTILLCRRHNGDVEEIPRSAAIARDLGIKYDRNAFLRPERAVVRYPDGLWYVLNEDGTRDVYEAPWLTEGLIEERIEG